MSPASFLQRPARWLEAISKYGATISGGPDFAYRLCIEKITEDQSRSFDLSRWAVAFNGSEPIRPSTMDRFTERFASCGFNRNAFVPCYGLAEATLFVSGKPAGEPPVLYHYGAVPLRGNLAVQDERLAGNHLLAGSGSVAEGLQVEIVDPETATPAILGQVGEIWITGPSVTQGYWRSDKATEEVFRAHTSTSSASFLRTGDLGFRLGDELFVTGRLKDLIIVRGQNHYPQDIESTAAASNPVLATSVGAAFSLDNESGSSVVLAQEIPRQIVSSEELTRLERAIRKAIGEQEGITLAVWRYFVDLHYELCAYLLPDIPPGVQPDGAVAAVDIFYTSGETSTGGHYDMGDVFYFVLDGEKQWTLELTPDPSTVLQLFTSKEDKYMNDHQPTREHITFKVQPGDCLYVPPYTYHRVSSQGPTLAVSIGLPTYTEATLLKAVLTRLQREERIWRPLPSFPANRTREFRDAQGETKKRVSEFLDVIGRSIPAIVADTYVHS